MERSCHISLCAWRRAGRCMALHFEVRCSVWEGSREFQGYVLPLLGSNCFMSYMMLDYDVLGASLQVGDRRSAPHWGRGVRCSASFFGTFWMKPSTSKRHICYICSDRRQEPTVGTRRINVTIGRDSFLYHAWQYFHVSALIASRRLAGSTEEENVKWPVRSPMSSIRMLFFLSYSIQPVYLYITITSDLIYKKPSFLYYP